MEMAGGSEFRAVEMANAISEMDSYEAVLLSERQISSRLKEAIGKKVEIHEGVFAKPNIAPLYSVNSLLVINTDSREFTTDKYWLGESERHSHPVDLSKIRQMAFLFNFIVSPSAQLPSMRSKVRDIRIITANGKFFSEISDQSRYEAVRHYPRLQLDSPISTRITRAKVPADRVRLGMHSLGASDKWNSQFPDLVKALNASHGDRIYWDFMGMPSRMASEIEAKNIRVRSAFTVPVESFLREIDIFVFFLNWRREEAWARSAAEAMMSGCPIVTTAKGGNKNQVIHGNTGFLCKDLDQFSSACTMLIDSPNLRRMMQTNATRASREFTPAQVVKKYLNFIEC